MDEDTIELEMKKVTKIPLKPRRSLGDIFKAYILINEKIQTFLDT